MAMFREKGEYERMREKVADGMRGWLPILKPLNPNPCKKRLNYPSTKIPMHLSLKGSPCPKQVSHLDLGKLNKYLTHQNNYYHQINSH